MILFTERLSIPLHGERHTERIPTLWLTPFQSTLPHRERLLCLWPVHELREFQSTLPHRERPLRSQALTGILTFQSTLPHRERQGTPTTERKIDSFNPRSRTGSDILDISVAMDQDLFQSTLPHRERRHLFRRSRLQFHRFNPRSRTGSDKITSNPI
jgi:hypothetical protein